ncbi:uncharacterized protein [Miscanthus floridulus]|uniref:uncharacterized protein n=1 Tax=Miscanthus floridulus TaxID=154761 RepID=UPI00345845A5
MASASASDNPNPIVVRAPSLPFTSSDLILLLLACLSVRCSRPRAPAVDFVVCSWAAAPRPWTYLATVASFPNPDDKIRSLSFKVQGGGNTGNALTAAARLGLRPRIISKVSNDAQGRNILKELQDDGIDTSYMLVAEDGNSPFTYIIVDNQTALPFRLSGKLVHVYTLLVIPRCCQRSLQRKTSACSGGP